MISFSPVTKIQMKQITHTIALMNSLNIIIMKRYNVYKTFQFSNNVYTNEDLKLSVVSDRYKIKMTHFKFSTV
jgi:hypothetical protein